LVDFLQLLESLFQAFDSSEIFKRSLRGRLRPGGQSGLVAKVTCGAGGRFHSRRGNDSTPIVGDFELDRADSQSIAGVQRFFAKSLTIQKRVDGQAAGHGTAWFANNQTLQRSDSRRAQTHGALRSGPDRQPGREDLDYLAISSCPDDFEPQWSREGRGRAFLCRR
jgi:hypothetical protein